jgi:hypothetical protein
MAALDYLKQRGLSARQIGNKLSVFPKDKITSNDRQYIQLHRMELLAELAANDGIEQRGHWQVYLNGKYICSIAGGPMTQQQALNAARFRWPDAEVQP